MAEHTVQLSRVKRPRDAPFPKLGSTYYHEGTPRTAKPSRGGTTTTPVPAMSATVRHTQDIPTEPVTAGTATSRQVLTGPGEGSGFHMRRFAIEPGGGMPRHRNRVEHQQFVLRGGAMVGIGDEVHQVRAGDVVHIPGGTPHWYRTEGTEPFEFLCVVPDSEDQIELLPIDNSGNR